MKTNVLTRNLAALLLMIVTTIAFALPPQSINYQAYLKDSGGQPVNASRNISFRIYDAEVAGIPLWTDTQSVAVSNGLLSVKLGSDINPLPKNALNTQLWLGVEVEADGEATPRSALASVNNAMYAENADTLDGMHADDIINASQGTPISSLPYVITEAGSYYLTGNISGGGGILVAADDVSINLRGYTLDGNNNGGYGIDISAANNVRISNGTIKRYAQAGIAGFGGTGHSVISHLTIANNGGSGIYLDNGSSRISYCNIESNSGNGIYVEMAATISNNYLRNNSGNYTIHAGESSTIENNRLTESYPTNSFIHARGIGKIVGNTITIGSANHAIEALGGGIISNNVIMFFSGTTSIHAGDRSIISDNVVNYGSTYEIIYAGPGSIVSGNALGGNGATTGITAQYATTITENTIDGQFGSIVTAITAMDNNTITRNTISFTGNSIVVANNNRVQDNHISNSDTGIRVDGQRNVVLSNSLEGNTDGIMFNFDGNFFNHNTAAGFANSYNLNGYIETDGGDNISF